MADLSVPLARPSTAFRIRDNSTGRPCNPTPIASRDLTPASLDALSTDTTEELQAAEVAAEFGIHNMLSKDLLVSITGTRRLETVTTLEIQVDTTEQSIAELGELLPNLTSLKLNNSVLASIRDLGTGLKKVRLLWLNRCGIKELDGIGGLTGLQELYLAFNDISELYPLALHETLELLDLDSNSVGHMNEVEQLGTCPNLTSLSLESNPVMRVDHYRRLVVHHIPTLEFLDDVDVTEADRDAPSDDIVRAAQCAEDAAVAEAAARPGTARARPATAKAGPATAVGLGVGLGVDTSAPGEAGDFGLEDGEGAVFIPSIADEAFMVAEAVRFSSGEAGAAGMVGSKSSPIMAGLRARSAGSAPGSSSSSSSAWPRHSFGRPNSAASFQSLSSKLEAYKRSAGDRRSRMMDLLTSLGVEEENDNNGSSSLTFGSHVTFGGNPVMALRRRKVADAAEREKVGSPKPSMLITETLDRAKALENKTREEVVAELKAWDLDKAVKELREASRADPKLRARLAQQRPGTSAGHRVRSRQPISGFSSPTGSPTSGQSSSSGVPTQSPRVRRVRDDAGRGGASVPHGGIPPKPPLARPSTAMPRAKGGSASSSLTSWKRDMGIANTGSSNSNSSPKVKGRKKKSSSSSSSSGSSSRRRKRRSSARHDESEDVEVTDEMADGSAVDAGRDGAGDRDGVDKDRVLWTRGAPEFELFSDGEAEAEESGKRGSIGPASKKQQGRGKKKKKSQKKTKTVPSSSSQEGTMGPPARVVKRSGSFKTATGNGHVDGGASGSGGVPTELGEANAMRDDKLVTMLRQKPKHVKELQTRSCFRAFFNGISRQRYERLLRKAFDDDEAKVKKRLKLMDGLLVHDKKSATL